jgi:hypothetical protein
LNANWAVQGYKFYSDFKVLPLQHFDVILGYDWLEQFSPMKVHWLEKWIAIAYQSGTVILQGMLSALQAEAVVQVLQLPDTVSSASGDSLDAISGFPTINQWYVEAQRLLHSYAEVFVTRVSFPLVRACSHSIPLITSARFVSIRPYRYAPTLKDEIEKQVKDML